MKILIAEDDATSRSILEIFLSKWGHEVLTACDGRDALDILLQKDAPRLAVMDWMMPEIDGLEVVNHVRKMNPDNPPYIILLTAKSTKSDIIAGLEAGADDYMSKPFDPGELRTRIRAGQRIISMQSSLSAKIEELHQAMSQIKTLKGLLPICSFCKKIRDDQGYWNQLENYISEHTNADFSHGICPECLEEHFPEGDEVKKY
jgi:phosphoserine phosphatase RsbU/P